jgi:hypothetical protein
MEGDEAFVEFERLVKRVEELAEHLAKRFGATETPEHTEIREIVEKLNVCREKIKLLFSDRP